METISLKQAIEKCGYGFRSLSLHSDGRWIAKSGAKAKPPSKLFTGTTPFEAVEKLLSALGYPVEIKEA